LRHLDDCDIWMMFLLCFSLAIRIRCLATMLAAPPPAGRPRPRSLSRSLSHLLSKTLLARLPPRWGRPRKAAVAEPGGGRGREAERSEWPYERGARAEEETRPPGHPRAGSVEPKRKETQQLDSAVRILDLSCISTCKSSYLCKQWCGFCSPVFTLKWTQMMSILCNNLLSQWIALEVQVYTLPFKYRLLNSSD
jgi:hypothetical protein